MARHKTIKITVDGRTVAGIEFQGQGIPILCFHGWLDNAESFTPLAKALPGRHLLAFDFPGHGRTYRLPQGTHYHYLELIPFVFAVADQLGLQQFDYIGHSMGGGVGSLAAGTLPQRFRKLVLIEGIGSITSTPEELPQQMTMAIVASKRSLLTKWRYYPTKQAAITVRAKAGDVGPEAAALFARRGLSHDTKKGYFWNADARLKLPSLFRLSENQVCAFLQQITAQTLLIKADQGLDSIASHFEQRREYVQDIKFITLPGNHHLHMSHPQAVAQAITAHLDSRLHTL